MCECVFFSYKNAEIEVHKMRLNTKTKFDRTINKKALPAFYYARQLLASLKAVQRGVERGVANIWLAY